MHAIAIKHCVLHFKFILLLNYISKKIQIIKKQKLEDPIFICNLCWKKIDYGKQLNMILCEHITNNQLVLILFHYQIKLKNI
jgi:hypothetical protein